MIKKKFISIDVMHHDNYVCTLNYPRANAGTMLYKGVFIPVIDEDDITAFVEEHRPSLRGKDFQIFINH